MLQKKIEIKVPARVCLYGDHQDYLGLPVIAATINRFIVLRAEAIQRPVFDIQMPDVDGIEKISIEQKIEELQPNDYFRSAMQLLQKKGVSFRQGYRITITSNIPINAGISSSSALVVGWVRFLLSVQQDLSHPSDFEVGHTAYEAEVLQFGQPGGLMDQYTIAQKGLLYIDTATGKCERPIGTIKYLIVAESGIAKQTIEVLKKARIKAQQAVELIKTKHPDFELTKAIPEDYERYKDNISKDLLPYWYATVFNYHLTIKAKIELEKPKPSPLKLGEIMNEHQHILQTCIGNTPPPIVHQINQARKAGALGAKIIGSGGGGCILALGNRNNIQHILEAFKESGAVDAYKVKIVEPK